MVKRYGLREDQRSWIKDILPGRDSGLPGRKSKIFETLAEISDSKDSSRRSTFRRSAAGLKSGFKTVR